MFNYRAENSNQLRMEDSDKRHKEKARKLGVDDGIDPFMTLAFLSLPVIPEIKLTTYGLVDVRQQKVIPVLL